MKRIIFIMLTLSLLVGIAGSAFSADSAQASGKGKSEGSGTSSTSGMAPGEQSNGMAAEEQTISPELTVVPCGSYWWVYGYTSWHYTSYLFYEQGDTYGRTSTEYGTSTGGCGTPLIVDRIYVKVMQHPQWKYGSYDKTAYNTNIVEASKHNSCWMCPTLCGASGYHEASKSGITWSVTTGNGCYTN